MNEPVEIGPFRCHRLDVGGEREVEASSFFSGCPPQIVAQGVARFQQGGAGTLLVARNCSLVEADGVAILIDPAGDMDAPGGDPLRRALSAIGKATDDIDIVLVTHVHEDRVAGMTEAGAPVFARARHLVHAAELEFLQQCRGWQPDGRYARLHLEHVAPVECAGLLETVSDGHAVWTRGDAAIVIEEAPGHTAGHYAVRIVAGRQAAVYSSDTFHHPVQMLDPRIATKGDLDSTVALATRKAMAARCADEGTLVIGSHFPGSGAGRLVGSGSEATFVPVGPGA